jgi:hypothetical protein
MVLLINFKHLKNEVARPSSTHTQKVKLMKVVSSLKGRNFNHDSRMKFLIFNYSDCRAFKKQTMAILKLSLLASLAYRAYGTTSQMLVNVTTHVNTAASVFQLIQVHYVNAAI